MSFLKNLRSSVARKQNAPNETSSARRSELSGDNIRRSTRSLFSSRKTEDQQSDGLIRSETFTIDQQESIFVRSQNVQRQSMFGRFSTFTKKKKGKESKQKIDELKNENLTSSYKRYPTPSDVVSGGNDPFHHLYNRGSPVEVTKSEHSKKSPQKSSVDYGTYKKSSLPTQVLEKLDEGRSISEPPKKQENKRSKEKRSESEDKYATVTINSFRKSFRERFLKSQKDVPYNPAWFVEVDAPKKSDKDKENERQERRDLLVFENEQYRPTARSPVRKEYKSPTRQLSDRSPTRHATRSPTRRSRSPGRSNNSINRGQSPNLSPIRSSTRSPVIVDLYDRPKPQPVKRNETFRVERENNEPSIRIEIKNSITPSEPGRIVPVGVARPMQSPVHSRDSKITQKRWIDPDRQNMYQTCIQITDPRDDPNRYLRDRNPNNQINQQSRSRKPTTTSGPIITNYSPLKSYELLSKIKRRDEMATKERFRTSQNSQIYDNKRWVSAPTFSSQQKISSYPNEKMVRKEATNNSRNVAANLRRAPIKTPWR